MDEAFAGLVALAARVQARCLDRGLTVATAESCTGGLIAAALTEVPGSSGYVLGGVVAYADRIKAALLEVPPDVIAAHGAVSAQVALAMATGARRRFGADLAVAVTGIAGPGGATDAKPLGLTYVALADATEALARRVTWNGDRAANRIASANLALEWLLERAGR